MSFNYLFLIKISYKKISYKNVFDEFIEKIFIDCIPYVNHFDARQAPTLTDLFSEWREKSINKTK